MVNDDNLIDFSAWTTIGGGLTLKGIQEIGDEIYAIDGSNKAFLVLNFLQFVAQINGDVQDFTSKEDVLVITTTESIQAYGLGFNLLASVNSLPGFEYVLQSGYAYNNIFYMGTNEIGMLAVPFGLNNADSSRWAVIKSPFRRRRISRATLDSFWGY